MDEPAVSVVIPTYDRAASLRRTLDALARCHEPAGGFEVVVVDDGSHDDTAQVAATASVPVRLIRQANAGPAAARNAGWRQAAAPIVAFTDDDTVADPAWLVRLVEPFQDPAVVGVGGTIEPLEAGFMAGFAQAERLAGHGVAPDGAVRYLATANAAYRREVLEAVGGFDESFRSAAGEDVDLSRRVAAAGGALVLAPDAVVAHDHRINVLDVLRTYHRHGRARAALARRHRDDSLRGGAAAVLSFSSWRRTWRVARAAGAGRSQAAAHVALRAAGLALFAAGVVRRS